MTITGESSNYKLSLAEDKQSILLNYDSVHFVPISEEIESIKTDIMKFGVACAYYYIDEKEIERIVSMRLKCFDVPICYPKDAEIKITITDDKMTAYLNMSPSYGGEELSLEKTYKKITEKGITQGLLKDVLEKAFRVKAYNEDILIAAAITPQDGEPEKIEPLFVEEKEGRVDTQTVMDGQKQLGKVKMVYRGFPVARIISPTKATPGKNIFGEEIQGKDGEKITLPLGHGVVVNNERTMIVASIDGVPRIRNSVISVFPTFIVEKDVDNSIGNVSFGGDIIIKGNLLSGLLLRAKGDVEISGSMDSAQIEAGGNVNIKSGVTGRGHGSIYCSGNLTTKYVDRCSIICGNDIAIEKSIINADIIARGKISADNQNAYIAGGTIKSDSMVSAFQIGNTYDLKTIIEIGANLWLKQELITIDNRIKMLGGDLEKLSKMLSPPEPSQNIPVSQRQKEELEKNLRKAETAIQQLKIKHKKLGMLSQKDKDILLDLEQWREAINRKLKNTEEPSAPQQNPIFSKEDINFYSYVVYTFTPFLTSIKELIIKKVLLTEMLKKNEEMRNGSGRVDVRGTIYPGVIISIEGRKKVIKSKNQFVSFQLSKEGELVERML